MIAVLRCPPAMPAPIVAVMQPYFYPYAGYFRLLAAADIFVMLDDVQFPRRGRVHRCEVPGPSGATEWLTLPLAGQARDVRIKDLAFHADARAMLDDRLRRLPWLHAGRGPLSESLREHLGAPLPTPSAFIETGLAWVAEALGFRAHCVRSSSLVVDRTLRGQAYVMALARAVGAGTYLNSPGGRHLYDAAAFAAHGLALRFLRPYEGRFPYLLSALAAEDRVALRRDILASAQCVP